ncbi:MAG: MotA/TolQ/ExbB proton channel family protein [Alistipes sp.]|nr:MotA/TolQ/ExbB proton channel family protein [Alistipes sp.]
MKKLFLVLAAAALSFSAAYAQEAEQAPANDAAQTEVVAETAAVETVTEEPAGEPMHFALMKKFLEGGWGWMLPVLVCLVLGLAISIERILYLTFAQINTKKFVAKVEELLNKEGIEAAKEYCRNTRGPIASIYYQGLMRYDQGLEAVEKAVVSYGSVQQGLMESGLSWISLFIALSPSLGFMGTVVGMIQAFDDIERSATMSPTVVAGGIKVALLTTIMGLIAAVILQVFFNYILSKIESQVVNMEDTSITLVDMLTAYNKR